MERSHITQRVSRCRKVAVKHCGYVRTSHMDSGLMLTRHDVDAEGSQTDVSTRNDFVTAPTVDVGVFFTFLCNERKILFIRWIKISPERSRTGCLSVFNQRLQKRFQ